ncbi:MAG: hypothetical protein ACOC93_03660 [Planctomycetota bacterium]
MSVIDQLTDDRLEHVAEILRGVLAGRQGLTAEERTCLAAFCRQVLGEEVA